MFNIQIPNSIDWSITYDKEELTLHTEKGSYPIRDIRLTLTSYSGGHVEIRILESDPSSSVAVYKDIILNKIGSADLKISTVLSEEDKNAS